jgi:hypothetical protein
VFIKHRWMFQRAAFSRSASGSTTLADLPPNSRQVRLMLRAAASPTLMPAPVEPVKDTISTPGCAAIASPTTRPRPIIRLNTPAGTPASCSTFASRMADRGEASDGFRMDVHPAAIA